MSDSYSSDYETFPDQFERRSPSSDRSERHFDLIQHYSSDENNSSPSYGRSLPKASKIIEILQKNSHPLSKDHRNPSTHVNYSKNSHDKHNYITNEKKGKSKEVQLKKPRNSDSPRSDPSYEDFYLADSRQEKFADDFYDYHGQYSSDFEGKAEEKRRNEERRTPVEPKKNKKDLVCKGSRGEYNEGGGTSEILKIIAQEKWKNHIKFSDISETTSEIWHGDDPILAQKVSMKSKSAAQKDRKKMPSDQSGLKDKDLDDLISELTVQFKSSRKDHDEYSQKKSNHKEIESRRETGSHQRKQTEVINAKNKGKNEEYSRLMEQLKKFPLNELRVTKKGNFDMRSQLTHDYLNLCEKLNQHPLEFYDQNHHKWQQKIIRKVEASDEEESEFQKVLNELKTKNKGYFESQGRTESQNMRQSKNQEKEILRATHVETLNRSDDSDELSYKGSESDDEEMKKRALEDLEKFNYAAIRVTREGRMSEKFPQEKAALYFKFCKDAGVHPIQYYRETGKKNISEENLEERIKTLLKNDGFTIKDLIFTKQGLPSKSSASQSIKNWLIKYGYYDEV